jgi:hypothetical protein
MASEFDLPITGLPKSVVVKETEDALKPKPQSEFDFEVKLPANYKFNADAAVQRIKKEEKIPFEDLYKKPENLQVIREYGETRFGESGKQKPDESDEDYAKRFMTAMRQVEWNTTLNAVPELNWLSNAKPDQVAKAARAHNLYDKTPSFYEEGGQPGIRPFAEATFSAISEPTNILSAGIGAGARYAVAREAIKNTLATKLKAAGIGAAAETVIGVGQNVIDQSVRRKTGVQEDEFDLFQMAIAGGLSAFGGAIEAGTGVARKNIKTSKQELAEKLAGKKKIADDPATVKLNEAFEKSQDEVLKEFDIFEGRKVLDSLSPQTELTQAQIRTDINRKAIDVAKYVMILSPDLRPKEGQKVSDAVRTVFNTIDSIDGDVIDAALKKADLTPQQFADATRTTVADAANVMQSYSALSRTLKKVASLDPEAQKLVDEMYGRDHEAVSMMGNGLRAINRLERESKALVVSGIGTTIRNILGTGTALTFDAASKLIDGALYTTGKAITGLSTGKYTPGDLSKGLNQTVGDAFATFGYMGNAGLTAETVDQLLKNNPNLSSQLFSALQESDKADLSKVARAANTLNMAQDVYFRRAIFAASVQRQMNRVGVDMFDVLANNKQIPVDVLKNATDETLKATFSYTPKQQKAAQRGAEAMAEGLAHNFVNFFEKIPGGSLMVTFPRFMSNAMAFQYRYSPLGAAAGMGDIANGARRIAKDEDGGLAQLNQGLGKFSKGVVGTAAIYAAYKYRLENQDSEWYNVTNEDGSTVDTRALFPIAPYLAVGDFLAKQKLGRGEDAKLTELATSIMGMKMPAGTQGTLLDTLPQYLSGAEGKDVDKLSIALGRMFGDFAGRFVTPGKPVFEYLDLFDEEAQLARDPNVMQGPVTEDRGLFLQSAQQRVMSKIPGLKEELPTFQPYFSNQAPVRAGEFFNSLTGMRVTPPKPVVEKEFVKLNLDPYAFFGSTGDKVYDRAFIAASVPRVESMVGNLINSDRYKSYSVDQKRIAMRNNMEMALSIARAETQAKMTSADKDRVNKMKFDKNPAVVRRAINELYAQENNGKTLEEAKDYGQVYKYEALIQRYR